MVGSLGGAALLPATGFHRLTPIAPPGEVVFTDITAAAGLSRAVNVSGSRDAKRFLLEEMGGGAAFFDYDHDGWLDIFLVNGASLDATPADRKPTSYLFHNNRDGTFTDVTHKAGLTHSGWGQGCCVGDYDNDGFDDLFVSYWGRNVLYRNNGDGTFTDVSDASGVSRVTGRYSMTAAAADLDGDGWIDIYVATDSTAAILYRNNRDGTFTDVALPSGAAYNEMGSPQAGMGLALGDVDADGALDILKTHFADDIPALYRNRGRGLFEDVAVQAGLAVQNRYVQWGAGLPDLDNDGWMDVFYVTGNVYPEVEAALPVT